MSRSISAPKSQANQAPVEAFPADLLVTLDRSQPRALRAQLERGLRDAIQGGRLPAGSVLPPSRTLAHELAVARSVVVEAYGQLVAEGYLEARQGSNTRVRATEVTASPTSPERERQDGVSVRFLSGLPDPASFPRREWLKQYRTVLSTQPDAAFGYPTPQGAIELRRALAGYLGRVRAVRANPAQLLVCGGFSQALTLICRALGDRGVASVAVEDPCFSFHRRLIRATGLEPIPVPVDEHGIDVGRLSTLSVGAVLLAPAHSYPTGAVLSSDRRVQLIDWARATDALVIEDDYDAEFRYDRSPVGALQGMAPEHVVYGGSVSKVLSPAVRIGWLAAPDWLMGELLRAKFLDDIATETLGQLTLARFIDDGGLARHLRHVRPIYRRRRDTLLDALAAFLPDATPAGIAAGLHLYVRLPRQFREDDLIKAARQYGVQVDGAARNWADRKVAPPALVVGYATLHQTSATRGIAALSDAYHSLETRSE